MFKTSAWPLALLYSVLIVFASLFPFEGWRVQGVSPWFFITERLPPAYWTWFDINTNIAGYVPLGFFIALGAVRSGLGRWAVPVAVLCGAMLSLSMEFLQIFLPRRVPSNLDFLLNVAGSFVGAVCADVLARLGWLDRWSIFRERWFGAQPQGGLVLLALWPVALLFPAAVPFGLGQMWVRLDKTLDVWLEGTPFMNWLPLREAPLEPLTQGGEGLCVLLGILAPVLLGYSLIGQVGRRAVFLLLVGLSGVMATGFSFAMAYGPEHAWAWLTSPSRAGVVGGAVVAALLLTVPRRWCAVLLMVVLMWQMSWLNQAPTSAYFAATLQSWEQGRFMRFYGVGQWLGWAWPYAVLLYVALRLSARQRQS